MDILNRFTAALKGAAPAAKPAVAVNELSAAHVASGMRLLSQVAKDYASLAALEVPGIDAKNEDVASALIAGAFVQNLDAVCDWCDAVAPVDAGKGTKLQPVPAALRRVATVLLAVYWSNLTLAERCSKELHVVLKATETLAKAA